MLQVSNVISTWLASLTFSTSTGLLSEITKEYGILKKFCQARMVNGMVSLIFESLDTGFTVHYS